MCLRTLAEALRTNAGRQYQRHRLRSARAPVALLRRPISEELAVALCQSLALEGRERLAELISACVPHASNRLGIRSSKTPHEQSVVAEVLLQFRPRPNTRAMPASLHRHHARGCLRTRAGEYTCATGRRYAKLGPIQY